MYEGLWDPPWASYLSIPSSFRQKSWNWLPNLTITLLGSTRREQAQNEKHSHKLEIPGFDPRTSRMLSERSTTVPHPLLLYIYYIFKLHLEPVINYLTLASKIKKRHFFYEIEVLIFPLYNRICAKFPLKSWKIIDLKIYQNGCFSLPPN